MGDGGCDDALVTCRANLFPLPHRRFRERASSREEHISPEKRKEIYVEIIAEIVRSGLLNHVTAATASWYGLYRRRGATPLEGVGKVARQVRRLCARSLRRVARAIARAVKADL